MTARLLSAAIGLWLMASPSVFALDDPAAGFYHSIGPIVATISIVAVSEVMRSLRWLAVPLGILIVLGAALPGSGALASANGVICGGALVLLAPLGGQTRSRFGGGWTALK